MNNKRNKFIEQLKASLDINRNNQTEQSLLDTFDPQDLTEDNIIILNDESGEDVKFEFLDLIEYDGQEYVVLPPVDDDADEIMILKIDESDNEYEEFYISVDDTTLNAVFKIFKEKFKEEFNFLD